MTYFPASNPFAQNSLNICKPNLSAKELLMIGWCQLEVLLYMKDVRLAI